MADHGLSEEEYARIVRILGREPTFTELGVFSAMWSEHCGYKNSKRMLRLLPTQAPWVIQGPGENAGVIDIGDGYALAFKIESHNHPSAVEPYQGAATGVGGILRDIFTMGARPIAVLDSLRFGDLDSGRVRYLFSGVVAGVGDYGNCVGIPNIGGETFFDRGYEGNPIVNAMCLGLMKQDELITASASGTGNALMAVGARTGRDGIHGATFASEELSEDSDEASRPQVQVGDPFTEKLLLEASLELIASGAITGIQDMGAAGITSSASEMAGRGGSGVEIDMARVPVREPGMTPYEILLSESQERMLVVAEQGKEAEVHRILEKWELEAAVIGRVTDDGRFRVLEDGRVVADIPALPLTEGCPTYEREGVESAEVQALRAMDLSEHAAPSGDLSELFLRMLGSPNVASKRWIYRQYDTTVRTSTAVRPGGDAGVVRIRGTRRAVAATTDCNGRYVYLDPGVGARAAMAEAARNLVCVGALPTAITNNLNFGNPLKPHIYHQFREAVLGMAEACRVFETPVTGGNVSFYNETDGRAIYPTPVSRHGGRRGGRGPHHAAGLPGGGRLRDPPGPEHRRAGWVGVPVRHRGPGGGRASGRRPPGRAEPAAGGAGHDPGAEDPLGPRLRRRRARLRPGRVRRRLRGRAAGRGRRDGRRPAARGRALRRGPGAHGRLVCARGRRGRAPHRGPPRGAGAAHRDRRRGGGADSHPRNECTGGGGRRARRRRLLRSDSGDHGRSGHIGSVG